MIGKLLVALIWVGTLQAGEDQRFLDAVRKVESSDGKFLYGRAESGKVVALGPYQIRETALEEVNRMHKREGKQKIEWSWCLKEDWGRYVSDRYLTYCRSRLKKNGVVSPTYSQVYAAYYLGVDGFKRVWFQSDKAPKVVKRQVEKVERLANGTN